MSLALEISSLESEIEQLRTENNVQRQHIGVLEFENEQLRRANDRMASERDIFMRRSEAIRALLESTGSMLVTSLKRYHDGERELEKPAEPKQLEKAGAV